jgi:hypothetical protein
VIYNAGGTNSYLANGELVKILAYDYKHTVVMPTDYSHKKHFVSKGNGKFELESDYVQEKLHQMIDNLVKMVALTSKKKLLQKMEL